MANTVEVSILEEDEIWAAASYELEATDVVESPCGLDKEVSRLFTMRIRNNGKGQAGFLTSQMFPSRLILSAHMSAPLNQALFWPLRTPLKTVALAKEEQAMTAAEAATKNFMVALLKGDFSCTGCFLR